jgi:hypothetical protein
VDKTSPSCAGSSAPWNRNKQNVAGRTDFIADPQPFCRAQLLHQLANRFRTIGNRPQTADRAIRLGNDNRFGMDIQTKNRTFSFMTDSSPRVALRYDSLRLTD